jgi:transporter family protein
MYNWIFYALLSAVFAALVAIFGKIGLSQVDSTLATTIRAIVMALFLTVVALAIGKFGLISSISDKKILFFIILSGIAGALSWLCYFVALKIGPAPAVAALDRLSVAFVLIFSIMFLGVKFNWAESFGAVLMVIGAVLMVFK